MAFGIIQDLYDKPFQRWTDLAVFTGLLVACGYWPYQLHRHDNLQYQTVWAKSRESVREYAPGTVTKLELKNGAEIQYPAVIVLDESDGGHVNVNGTHISSQRVL